MQVELILLILSLLFFASIFTDRIGNRFGVPALLLFLLVGMVFGPDGLGSYISEDGVGYISSIGLGSMQAISTIAMCVILYSGGMDTKMADIRPVVAPGVTLSTVGVMLTALFSGILIYFIFGWINALVSVGFATALLMASTMSSTDTASVFSILRTNKIGLKHNLRPLLEVESGANDPMAYILTVTLIGIVTAAQTKELSALTIAQEIVVQLIVGGVMGFALGKVAVSLMRKTKITNESLYPIMILTFCIFIYSVTYYMKGNGYLAVYMGGLIIGNSKFARKRQTKSFFEGLTWLSQLLMFLLLGLMVKPHELLQREVWLPCLIISFVMIFISRPLSVFICMHPFKEFQNRDKVFISWVGLKGAVPIIFAILCMANNVPNAGLLFNVVFLCTIVSLIMQGSTLTMLARSLRLTKEEEHKVRIQHFDIELPEEVDEFAQEIQVTADMLQSGSMLKEMNIPDTFRIIMTRRGENFFVPSGKSVLKEGDWLLIITEEDVAKVQQNQEQEDDYNLKEWRMQIITNTGSFFRDRWNRLTQGSSRSNS
ncbi:MAG: potassium/proton antiporter [Paludibacteraceae bacterium]|nr:potassium/proton antiporter [Paludibacteraceae bacterium]